MKKSPFGKTTISLKIPEGIEEYAQEFSLAEANDQLLMRSYGEL